MRSAVTGRPLPLLGGAACLDFVNTVDPRLSPPQEDFLATFPQLAEWARYVRLLSAQEERSMLSEGARNQGYATEVHARALQLRKALYQLLRPGAPGRPVSDALKVLNDEIQRAGANRKLVAGSSGYRLTWLPVAPHDRLFAVIAESAVDLLTSPRAGLIRECAGDGCGWLFLDTSKAHRRRWCNMAICGNRAKAQRHRQRTRAARKLLADTSARTQRERRTERRKGETPA